MGALISASECEAAVTLAEDQGASVHALVETGSTQTLVHQTLIRSRGLLEAEWVEVGCVYGDMNKYPIVVLLIKIKGKMHKIKAAVSLGLLHL